MRSKTCLLHYSFFSLLLFFYLGYLLFVSAALDVDPGNVVGLATSEPAVADKDAAGQTAREQPVEQPTVASVAETTEEDPTRDKARASTPTRVDETVRTPPPSSVVEEGDKVPTPLQLKKRGLQLRRQRRLPLRRAPLAEVGVQ